MLMLYSGALFLIITSLLTQSVPESGLEGSPIPNYLLASGLFFSGILLLPAGFYSLQRLNGKPVPPAVLRPVAFWQWVALGVLWASTAALTTWLFSQTNLVWLIPPLYLLGVSLPVLLLVRLGAGGLPLGSRQRAWGVFGIGLILGPSLATIVEGVIYLLAFLGGVILLVIHPDWMKTIQYLGEQVYNATDLNTLLSVLGPYLINPIATFMLLTVVSVLIPIIEETVKPIGIWLMIGRIQSPPEGFALGVISGAGFALIEGLIASASASQDWGFISAARAGGSLMHILATGLMGWGIASFWKTRRYLRLLATFGAAVLIHGTWNGLAVLTLTGLMRVMLQPEPIEPLGVGMVTLGLSIFIAMICTIFVTLWLFNRRLHPSRSLAEIKREAV